MVSLQTQQYQKLQAWLVAFLFLLILPTCAVAETIAAQVLFSHGNVVLTNNAGSYPLEKGAAVSAGDTVITGNDGRIQMRFTDGGLVSLMPNSQFAVEEYSQPSANSEGSVSVNLLKGGLRALSGSIGKKNHDNYQLKTDVATLGIRGTQFVVVMDGAAMRVHVGQGSVALFNDFGELLVPTGMHAEVFPGQPPKLSTTPPAFVSANRPNTQSEEEQSANNQSPVSASQHARTDVMRTLDTMVINGEESNEDQAPVEPGPIEPDPLDPSIPTSFEDGFAFAVITTELATDLVAISYGPKFAALMQEDPSGSYNEAFKEMADVRKVGELYWGMSKDNNINQEQVEHSLLGTQVWGAAATELPLEGTLSYKLNEHGALPMHTSWEGEELTQFDMDIHIHGNNRAKFLVNMATSNMGFSGVANDEGFITSPQSGGAEDYGIGSFNFTAYPTGQSECGPNSCELDVSGFLSGKGGAQAGVVYNLKTPDGDLGGGAILDKH